MQASRKITIRRKTPRTGTRHMPHTTNEKQQSMRNKEASQKRAAKGRQGKKPRHRRIQPISTMSNTIHNSDAARAPGDNTE